MSKIHAKHRVPGTGIVVDCFNRRASWITHRFLSHCHADHYSGLRKEYNEVPILCSETTGRLVEVNLGVDKQFIHVLPMYTTIKLDKWGVEGWTVYLLNANHCPGAVMFVFEGNGKKYLHTGDMRFDENVYEKEWKNLVGGGVDVLYLDTTYCNPKYVFPTQDVVIEQAVDAIVEEMSGGGSTLVLIPTYTIGKEKVLVALSKRLKKKVRVSERKARSLKILEFWDDDIYSEKGNENSPLIVLSWGVVTNSVPWGWNPKFEAMASLFNAENARIPDKSQGYNRVVALVATGWSFQVKSKISVQRKDHLCVIGVPYSEHSSYSELLRFVELVKPKRVIPTVGNSSAADEKRILSHFHKYIDSSGAMQAFFGQSSNTRTVKAETKAAKRSDVEAPPKDSTKGIVEVVEIPDEASMKEVNLVPGSITPEDEDTTLQIHKSKPTGSLKLSSPSQGQSLGKRARENKRKKNPEPPKKTVKTGGKVKHKQKLISSFFRPK